MAQWAMSSNSKRRKNTPYRSATTKAVIVIVIKSITVLFLKQRSVCISFVFYFSTFSHRSGSYIEVCKTEIEFHTRHIRAKK